jgi:tetratricopeptide (TPR) repeat protein
LAKEDGKVNFPTVKLTYSKIAVTLRTIIFFLFGLLLLTAPGIAQRNTKDSLSSLLKTQLTPIDRIEVLNQLAYQYYDYNDSLALNYSQEALRLAQQANYPKGLKYAYIMVGLGYSSKAEFKRAIHYFRLSDAVHVMGANEDAAYGLVLLGNCYRERADYDSANFFYRKAKFATTNDDARSMASIYKNMASVDILLWKNNEAIILLDSANGFIEKSKSNSQYIAVDLLTMYGQVFKNILKYDLSNQYYEKMCMASSRIDDYYHLVMCKLNYADLAFQQGNYTKALKFGFEALELTKKYAYPPQYVKVLIAVGEIYEELSQYEVAAEYFFKALAISDRFGLQAETAWCYSQLAWIKKDQGRFFVAIDYANKSLGIREAIGDKKGIANCHNVLGLIYLLQKDYPRSIREHELALKLRQQIDYKLGISASIFNLSLTYEAMNQLSKALDYQRRCIEMEEKIQNKQSMAISYNSIAELLIKVGNLKEALVYANKATLLGEETGSTLLKRNNASIFVAYYQALGDFRKALAYQQQYQALDDSVYSETSALKLAEVEAIYNVEKKEKDIELLSEKQVAQARQLQLQQVELSRKNLIIGYAVIGILIFGISGIVGIRYYREKTKANKNLQKLNREISEQKEEIQAQSEELVEASDAIASINKELEVKIEVRTSELKQAYKELDTFFYRASHDFRRPITTFMGLAGVAKVTIKDQASLELFEKVV